MTHRRVVAPPVFALVAVFTALAACGDDPPSVVAPGGLDGSVASDSSAPTDSGTPATLAPPSTLAAAPSVGCGGSAGYPAGTTTEDSLLFGGKKRTFRVHVPPNAGAAPLPVVLAFHGGGGSGDQAEGSFLFDAIADRERFVVVYPDGSGLVRTWNGGGCCGASAEDNVDDVGFVRALLGKVDGALCVDDRRVFATGMSNGGILSHRLGCELSDRIAAIAPVAGTIAVTACTPARPVPVMHVHGDGDAHVPFNGGTGCGASSFAFTSVAATLDGWRSRNGCAATTDVVFAQGDGTCVGNRGCAADVILCTVRGGGHSWPGGAPKVGVSDCADAPQNTNFGTSELAWRFFQGHPRP